MIKAVPIRLCPAGLFAFAMLTQAQTTPILKFEAASIKPCKPGEAGARGGGGGGSSERLSQNCSTVLTLVRQAFVQYADGRLNLLASAPVEGGPNWIDSESYQIEATADGTPGEAMLKGPMLQVLLEERFKLKIRRETREVPVYALTVAKGGPKLQPTREGSCIPLDAPPPTSGPPQYCGVARRGDPGLHLIGETMTDLCRLLSVPEISDRPTIDKTGITGMFDIQLPGPGELNRAGHGLPVSADTTGAAIDPTATPFEALRGAVEKLGLNLERSKGPGEFLVIEHVERPSEN